MQEFVTGSAIFTVDALYYQPQLAAIHLVKQGDSIAIVDTGTQYSLPQVESALHQLGLDFNAVELIILTHIHLDHAGGASALMDLCPNAKLVVHSRGARHMADPTKLIAGSMAVYGNAEFKRLYGDIKPIDASRIVTPEDGGVIKLGDRAFEFLDSPGHASHHFCIVDQQTNSIFTGDTLGIAYQSLRDSDHAFVMPTTTPVQFNPEALHASIDKVMAKRPDYLYYTHYGPLQPTAMNIAGLHEQIDDFVMLTGQVAEQSQDFEAELASRLKEYLIRRAYNELSTVDQATIEHWTQFDAMLNAQGLAFWWQHRRVA